MRSIAIAVIVACVAVPAASAQTAADSAGIRQAALDYAEGWYAGDAARMERAVHPELAKRIAISDPRSGRTRVEQMSAMTLVNATRRGFGKETPAAEQRKDVRILDIFRGAATARVDMAGWIDYMHLAKTDGQWRIVNVLWETRAD